jgi:preprotein translocase subunit YajC
LIHILAQSSSQSGSGSSMLGLLLPMVMIVGLYFIMIRPQRQRQKQQQALLQSLEVGDDVMISGGIYGVLTEIDDETGTVRVEIAPDVQVTMLRQGVLQRVSEEEPDQEDEDGDEGWDDPEASDEEADHRP